MGGCQACQIQILEIRSFKKKAGVYQENIFSKSGGK
jgi:hypothetical protein